MFSRNKTIMIAGVALSFAMSGVCEADNYYFRHRGSVASKPETASIQFVATGVRAGSQIAAHIETSIPNGSWRLQQTPENPSLGFEASSDVVHGTAPFVSAPTTISVTGYVTKGMQSASANETSLTIYPELALSGGPKDKLAVQTGAPVGAYPQLQPNGLVGTASYQLVSGSTAIDISAICPGLWFSETSGQIAGTPVNDCYSPVKIRLVDSFDGASASTETFSLVTALTVAGKSKPMLPGASYSFDLKTITSGGHSPYSYTVSNLPSGLTSDSSGVITGTVPAVVYPTAVYIIVKDESGQTTPATVQFDVATSNVLAQGWNDNGQLGIGSRTSAGSPVPVSGGKNYTKVSAGSFYACGIVDDGTVQCWGTVPSSDPSLVPYTISGLRDATEISAGPNSTCAIEKGGALKCWGKLFGDKYNAILTVVSSGATSISIGLNHACAIVSGRVQCWGSSERFQTSGSGLTGATAIASGGDHTCAVIAGGVKCWGGGSSGELGNGTTISASYPVQVTGLTSGVSDVSAGASHSCAVVSGAMKCWGSNYNDTLGATSAGQNAVTPVDVRYARSGVTSIDSNEGGSCAVISGIAKCWGQLYLDSSSFPAPLRRSGFSAAKMGRSFALVY